MPRDGEKKGLVASGTKCNVWVIGCAVIGPDTGHLVGVIERNSAFVMCVVNRRYGRAIGETRTAGFGKCSTRTFHVQLQLSPSFVS